MKNQERKRKSNLLQNHLFRLFFLLLCSCGAFAQNPITRVQSSTGNSGNNAATSFAVTLSSTPINGNTLVAIIATRGNSANRVTSISQTGATWTRATQATNTNGSTTEIWFASNVSSASKTITINQSNLRSAAVVIEYDEILTLSPLDLTANSTGNSTSASTGTTSTTIQANELLIGGIGLVNSGHTLGTLTNSFTSVANSASTSSTSSNNARVYALEKLVSSTTTASSGGTVSTSSQWSGTIATFKAVNTVSSASSSPTLCINTNLTDITHATTGATGIGTATGLPTGVTASWSSNTITISGTPSVSGTFNYTIPLTGGSGSVNATGTITVTAAITSGVASSSPNVCINNALTPITHTTTGATGIGTASGLPTGVSASWASNTITISGTPTVSGTFNYSIPLSGGCGTANATGTIVVNLNLPVTQVGSAYTFCVDNGSTYTSATVSSSQYILVNVTKGFTYTFTVGNVFTDTENLTILDASTDGNVSPATYASGASGASINNWVSPLSGQIKVLLSNGTCSTSNGSGGAITLTLNAVGNTQDSQTAYGTDQWVAHVYNWTGSPAPGGASPSTPSTTTSPFTNANYVGYYNVPTESISDTFGGDYNCFPVYSNGDVRTNMYTEQFAVRYRMRSTKTGCYSLATTGDDGVRVYVDGVKVYDEWKEQSPTSYSNILLYLNGNSDIIFDYYENGGNNVNSFTLTPFDTSSNSIAQSSITVCSGVSAGLLNATSYTYNGSATNPTISFQWQSSTDNSTFTNISGATSEDYTPPTQTTTTTNVVRYYRRVVTATAATASGCSYTSNVTTVTTSPSVPATPGSISGTVYQCQSLTNQVYSISSVSNATSYNWTVPTGWTITAGAGTNSITVTTGTVGQNGNISVAAVNGCGTSSARTLAVTVNSNNTAGVASSSPSLCINSALTSITHTTTGATGIGTATGLPAGVTASWASNIITISGTPTVSGTFSYSIPLTGGCGTVNATGTINVTPANTVSTASSSPTLCISTALTAITHTTTGATGIGTTTGLPSGVTAAWASNTITISGTPTASGTFNYSIPSTGGCGTVNATGTIVVTPVNTVSVASSSPTLCVNTALTPVTHSTTGATGIGTATGLPSGVTANWSSNVVTISGTPTASGIFNYNIPLSGGCGTVSATGTISVNNLAVGGTLSGSANVCSNNNTTTLTLSGYTGTISKWQSCASSSFSSGVTDIANTSTTYTAYSVTSTTYYRAVITSGSCPVSYSSVASITVTTYPSGNFAYAAYGFCNSINTAQNVSTSNFTGVTGTYSATAGLSVNATTGAVLPSSSTVSGTPYTVTYSVPASGGCPSYSATTLVTIEAGGSGTISYFPTTICQGTTGTVSPTITGAGGSGSATWVSATPSGLAIDGAGVITPSISSTGTYTITYNRSASSLCPVYSNSTTVSVNASGTVVLSSAIGTNSQTKCINTAITNITYSTTVATGATVTGLPTGVSGTWSSNVVTISGTPTVSGTFNYTVTLTGTCATAIATGTIVVNPNLPASVSIGASATTICSGTSVTFTATPTNGGTTPTYQWKVNGTNVSGQTASTFTSTTLANNDLVTVVMTSNASPCLTGSPATSNTVTMTVNPSLPASVSIGASATTICTGTSVTFTATPTNGGTAPTYQWKVNGTNVSGQTASTFTSTTLANGNTVSVVMTSNATPCLSGSPATSNTVTMTVNPSLPASVSIGATATTICSGTSVTFTATPTNGGTTPSYQWKVNGSNVGTNSATYTTSALANGNTVSVVMTSNATPCLSGSPATSNTVTMTVNPNLPASVSIGASATTICSGTSVTFTATPTNGGSTPSYQWKVNGSNVGTNSATYTTSTLANGNSVTVVMTSNATACLTGSPATSNAIAMTVTSPSVGGSVSGGATICSGTNSTTLTLTGNTGSVTTWQSSSVSNFASSITDIANTSNSLTVTNVSSTLYYRAVVSNGSCSAANSSVATIQYGVPVGMSAITPLVSQLSGNATTTITASGVVGINPVVSWYTSSGQVGLLGTGLTSPSVGVGTYYAVVTGTCGSSVELSTTIRRLNNWTGAINTLWNVPGNWSENVVPDATMDVAIGNGKVAEIAANDAVANSISITGTGTLTVKSGKNLTLTSGFTTASATSLVLENNANLTQLNSTANTTPITVKRDTNALIRLDYTMWSSPVMGQKLLAFSPLTSLSPTVRFYTYNTTTNSYNSVSAPSTTDFDAGKGYLIRLPYNHPTAPAVWSGAFTGIPNNGTKVVALSNIDETHQYNAVGNPYPSPISIAQFMIDNASKIEPTIYFWRKTNNAVKPSYCTWNGASQTFCSNGEAFSANPNGVIQTGQGFIVEAKGNANSLEFNNGQRVLNNVSHFFKSTNATATSATESHRIWLNLTGVNSEYSQAVLGYFTNATQGADDYDSKLFNDGSVSLSMKIGSSDYTIQGRPTPFDASEVVPLTYRVTTAGSYTISIDKVDGLFTGGAQTIFLRDNLLGTCNNLTTSAYTFTSNPGTFETRFELLYQNSLLSNNTAPAFNANEVVIYHQKNDLIINTGVATMSSIKIFNIKGALLFDKKEINASETRVDIGSTNEVLLVEIVTTEGVKVVKKVYSELVIGSDDDE